MANNNSNTTLQSTTPTNFTPGPYVILQGSNGDGMANSLDVLPDFNFNLTNFGGRGIGETVRRGSLNRVKEVDDLVDDGDGGCGVGGAEANVIDGISSTNRNNLYADDTEGGLHLPLGASSPIMRKLHHQTASSLHRIHPMPKLDLNHDANEAKAKHCNSIQNETDNIRLSPTTVTSSLHAMPLSTTTAAVSSTQPSTKIKQQPPNKQSQAIQQWQTSCQQKEMHLYEEAHQNIRAVLTQRRKQYASLQKKASNGSCSRPAPASTMLSSCTNETYIQQLDHVDEMLEWATHHRSWYQHHGRLVVLQSLPHLSLQGVVTHPVVVSKDNDGEDIATLSPGSIIHATDVFVLDSRTLKQLFPVINAGHHGDDGKVERGRDEKQQQQQGQAATIQFFKITSPYKGYIVSHLHDYPYVAPGSPLDHVPNYKYDPDSSLNNSSQTDSTSWMWRVLYQPDGAFVRNGPELISDQIATLPYGSFCSVKQKIVNEMGLSRLKVSAVVKSRLIAGQGENEERERNESEGWKEIEGWTSLFINPLSGNSGKILEPVNFPVPVLYRVVCEKGAVIRSGIEISTSEIGLAAKGTVLSVIGRAFSDHPRSCCIERLRLAGGRGWISSRLSGSCTGDRRVVELVGLDESYDPENPAEFHFKEHKKAMSAMQTVNNNTRPRMRYHRQISEINDDSSDQEQSSLQNGNDHGSSTLTKHTTTLFQNGMPSTFMDNTHPNRCLICLSEERTATIVHGETGHIACCLTCARVLKARGDACPVCREPIDTVIQHFWA